MGTDSLSNWEWYHKHKIKFNSIYKFNRVSLLMKHKIYHYCGNCTDIMRPNSKKLGSILFNNIHIVPTSKRLQNIYSKTYKDEIKALCYYCKAITYFQKEAIKDVEEVYIISI